MDSFAESLLLEIFDLCCPKGSDHPRRTKHISNRSRTIPVQAYQDTRCSGRCFSHGFLNLSRCHASQRSTSFPGSLEAEKRYQEIYSVKL